jgi:hypothetical protein
MPYCKSGRHFWTQLEDSKRCCNGFKRVVFDQNRYGWEPVEIKPLFYKNII